MAKGKTIAISLLLLLTFIILFFIVNIPTFTPSIFLGVPYNPFVVYFYLTLLIIVGIIAWQQ